MIQIKIETTPRGLPALREHINGDLSRSLIILNQSGKLKKATNKKGLVRVEVGDIVIICMYNTYYFSKVNKFIIVIYEILELDTEQLYATVKEINSYSDDNGWSETLPEHLIDQVEKAKRLAAGGVKHA